MEVSDMTLFLGTPLWMWFTFIGLVIALLVLDLGMLAQGWRAGNWRLGKPETVRHVHRPWSWLLGLSSGGKWAGMPPPTI